MNQTNHTSLIKLENVNEADAAKFYLGKKLCYVYKAKTKKKGTRPSLRGADGFRGADDEEGLSSS